MFTHHPEEHSVVTRTNRSASQTRAKRLAAWCASVGLAVSIAGALVLVVSQIVFGREPIGGASGLVLLYPATAVAGIGLAVLRRIVPVARRASDAATAASYLVENSPSPKARTNAREAA